MSSRLGRLPSVSGDCSSRRSSVCRAGGTGLGMRKVSLPATQPLARMCWHTRSAWAPQPFKIVVGGIVDVDSGDAGSTARSMRCPSWSNSFGR